MLYFLPLESFEERYTSQWLGWFQREFDRRETPYRNIKGTPLSTKIRQGKFLDVISTNHYKATQMALVMNYFDQNMIEDGDVFFLLDGWYPGLEMLAYVRDALKINFKIAAIFHAGTYDPWDYLTQCGMRVWGQHSERSWLEIIDHIFVATNFHKDMIMKTRASVNDQTSGIYLPYEEIDRKIHVTGLPVYSEFVKPVEKENIVVFPHRLDPEKQPNLFDEMVGRLMTKYPNWSFLKTKSATSKKQYYYKLLNKAKISVSFAFQETFGIAMIESVMCGCLPIVPDRLSYQELYPSVVRFTNFEQAVELVDSSILYYEERKTIIPQIRSSLVKKGAEAIPNMLKIMGF